MCSPRGDRSETQLTLSLQPASGLAAIRSVRPDSHSCRHCTFACSVDFQHGAALPYFPSSEPCSPPVFS